MVEVFVDVEPMAELIVAEHPGQMQLANLVIQYADPESNEHNDTS